MPPSTGDRGAGASIRLDELARTLTATLKTNPGAWARVRTGKSSGSFGGLVKRLRAAGCETTSRRIDAKTFGLWARHP